MVHPLLRRTAVAAVVLAASFPAPAAGQTWTGAVSGSWSNANNWSPAAVPLSNINTALVFQNTSPTMATAMTNDVAGTFLLNRLNVLAGSPAFTLGGNPLDFRTNISNRTPLLGMNSGNPFTIGNNVVLTNDLLINGSGAGTLTFNGVVSGPGGLTYSGGGTLALGGASNTYAGGTNVNNGTLALTNGFAIPTGTGVAVAAGATFNTNGLSNGTPTASSNAIGSLVLNGGTFRVPAGGDYWLNGLTLNGGTADFTGATGFTLHFKNASGGMVITDGSTIPGGGNVVFRNDSPAALPVYNDGSQVFTADMLFSAAGANPTFSFSVGAVRPTNTGNTANMTFNTTVYVNDLSTNVGGGAFGTLGTGTITVSALYYDGPTAASAKPLTLLNGPQPIIQVVTPGANLTLNGVISQSVAGTPLYVYAPGSTLTLTAANSYTGPTIVIGSGATLAVSAVANGGVNSPLGAASNAPGNLQLGGSTDRGTLLLTGTNAAYSTDRGATVAGLYADAFGGAIGVQNAGTTLTVSGQITGAGSFIKTGPGTLVLGNATNNYAGGTYIEGGTLTLGSPAAIPNGGAVTVFAGGVLDVGTANSGGVKPGVVTLSGGTLRAASLANAFFGIGSLVIGPGGGTIDGTISSNFASIYANSVTVNGDSGWTGPSSFTIGNSSGGEMPISIAPGVTVTSGIGITSFFPSASNPIRVTGGGTLYLTNPAQFVAVVRVNQARLRMDDLTNVAAGHFDLTLDNGTLQYGGPTATAGGFAVGGGGGTLEVLNPATTLTLTGAIPVGYGGLTKAGPGTLVLANAGNQFNGLTVNAGVVQTATDGALGSGGVTVAGGSLQFTADATSGRTFYLNAGALAVAAGSTLTFSGATVNGGFLRGPGAYTVAGGSVLAGTSTTASTAVTVTGPGTLQNFSSGGALAVAPGLAGPVVFDGFTNQGSGAMTLTAGSAVTASDFQSYGTLSLTPAAVGSGQQTRLTNTGATPLYFNGGSRTFVGTPATAGQGFLAGIDLHGQNAVVAGGLLVNNGFVADSTNGGAVVVADFGALVKGAGFFQDTVETRNGGKFQAGNSPGAASFGRLVLGPGGVDDYVFVINDAAGTAGPAPDVLGHVSGWSVANVVVPAGADRGLNGDFLWTAAPASRLTVALETLVNPTTVGDDVPGPMDHFDPARKYVWPAVVWAGNYRGPTDPSILDAATAFDASGFVNPVAGRFGWALDPAGHTLSIVYTPTGVPEPGTLALVAAGLVPAVIRRRRGRVAGGA